MAAGIIDHETGTRDIRRLSGLYRFMPITATLAMVAAAAMAGVPLLNGFLSKEMFFAEGAGRRRARCRALDRALPYIATLWRHVQRRLLACASSTACSSARRRRACRARRTSRRAGCACRSSCWCSPAWWSACLPALTIGPFLDVAVRAVLGAADAAVQPCGLARLHRAAADELGRARRRRRCSTSLLQQIPRARRGAARRCCRRSTARRIFDACCVAVSWRWARALEALLGTQRLQPQLRWLRARRARGGALAGLRARPATSAPLPLTPVDPALRARCGSSAGRARSARRGRRSSTASPR